MRNEKAVGNCYQAAYEMLTCANKDSVVLCHGIARQTVPPHAMMGHAWVEWTMRRGAVLVTDGLYPGSSIQQELYYRVGMIDPATVRRYTLMEALELVGQNETYGPWDAVIAAASHAERTVAQ